MVNINQNIINILFIILFYLHTHNVFAGEDILEPENYKMDDYRSKTPTTLKGATVVDAKNAMLLHESGQVLFFDVLPSPKRPAQMKDTDIWLPKKRMNIPGSFWLADVGYGVLSDDIENYFKASLKTISNDHSQGLLFYCQIDCWMSWNAAKRTLAYGYSKVYWFPGGVDEWAVEGYPLEQSNPVQIDE